ncbi:MAG: TolC family protein [Elusimicrobia bacterium]|nr:TolC family protein [Elusimicrobiota bacterium]
MSPTDDNHVYMGRGTIEQDLYTGGRSRNAVVLAKASLEKAKNTRDKTKLRVTRDVRLAFLDCLSVKAGDDLVVQNLKELEAFKPRSSDEPLSRLLWEDERIALGNLRQERSHRNRDETVFALLGAIGMDPMSEIAVVGSLEELTLPKKLPRLEEALSWVREFRPEYKAEALESEMNATEVAIALASRSPVVSLAGMYEFLGREFPLRTVNWSGMVRVHLPLSWDNWATIRERKAQQRMGQVKRVEIDDQIGLEVRRAFFDLKTSFEALTRRKDHQALWRELYPKAVSSGRNFETRIDLFKRYFAARRQFIDALTGALKAGYEFEYITGKDLE